MHPETRPGRTWKSSSPPGAFVRSNLAHCLNAFRVSGWSASGVGSACFGGRAVARAEFRLKSRNSYDEPFAEKQWTFGRRLDESQLRYCVDRRDPDWEVAAAIADAIAQGLLLEPQRYVVESNFVIEDITKVYAILLEHCDFHMGFKLIPGGYSDWVTLTRAVLRSRVCLRHR